MNEDRTSTWITTFLAAFSATGAVTAGYLSADIAALTGIGRALLIFVVCLVALPAAFLAIAGLIVLLSPIAIGAMRG